MYVYLKVHIGTAFFNSTTAHGSRLGLAISMQDVSKINFLHLVQIVVGAPDLRCKAFLEDSIPVLGPLLSTMSGRTELWSLYCYTL